MPIEFINKLVLIKMPVLENTLIFLVKAYLKLVLGSSKEIGHCKINEFVRLSATKSVRNMGFSSLRISCWVRSLISIKCINNLTKYVSQLIISIFTILEF